MTDRKIRSKCSRSKSKLRSKDLRSETTGDNINKFNKIRTKRLNFIY